MQKKKTRIVEFTKKGKGNTGIQEHGNTKTQKKRVFLFLEKKKLFLLTTRKLLLLYFLEKNIRRYCLNKKENIHLFS